MVFPGIGRQAWVSGSMGGGTGRTPDWNTYDGTEDTAWQQWIDETSTALGSTYQVINGAKNSYRLSGDSCSMGIDVDGVTRLGIWQLDMPDASSAQITFCDGEHNLGIGKILLFKAGTYHAFISSEDGGSMVVYDGNYDAGNKITGLSSIDSSRDWDATIDILKFPRGLSYYAGNTFVAPVNAVYVTFVYNSTGSYDNLQMNQWIWNNFNDAITSPSTPANFGGADKWNDHPKDIYNNATETSATRMFPLITHLSEHYESDFKKAGSTTSPFPDNARNTNKFMISLLKYNTDNTETEMIMMPDLINNYAYQGNGGYGGNSIGTDVGSVSGYRSNNDFRFYKSTGRPIANLSNNIARLIKKDNTCLFLYGTETGTKGGTMYITGATNTNEIMNEQVEFFNGGTVQYPAFANGSVAEMIRFDETSTANTHSNNAILVSNTPASDSTNTGFDPDNVAMADLESSYFAVAWRKSTTAYISIFSLSEQTSDVPTVTRVVDTVSLGTVPEGKIAIVKIGTGVALITCGNYYKFIKVPI
jgi:hypothetical protein